MHHRDVSHVEIRIIDFRWRCLTRYDANSDAISPCFCNPQDHAGIRNAYTKYDVTDAITAELADANSHDGMLRASRKPLNQIQ